MRGHLPNETHAADNERSLLTLFSLVPVSVGRIPSLEEPPENSSGHLGGLAAVNQHHVSTELQLHVILLVQHR